MRAVMNRRTMLQGAALLLAGGALAPGAWAAPFASRRIAVTTRGAGRDVVLMF